MLDSTVVALALPAIRHDVGASAEGLQWVMNGYLLTIAVLVVTAGRLGDMFGRKRVFLAGMVVFALGSVVSGAAGDQAMLIVGRVLQGVGAAPMLPLSLALVCNVFPAAEQPRALGIWAAVSALGAGDRAAGRRRPGRSRLAGDLLDQPAGRRARDRDHGAAPRRSRPTPAPARRIDLPGLRGAQRRPHRASSWRWSRPGLERAADDRRWPLVGRRRRCSPSGGSSTGSREPIVDFALFRNGPYFGASAAAFALVGAYWAVMFFQPQYLQDVRGHSAVLSGLLILPITVPMIFISPFSGRLIGRFGARRLMTAGMVCGVARPAASSPRSTPTAPTALLLAGYLLFGIALGLVYAPMSTAAMAAMPGEKVGIASGVLAMDRVLAGAVALAATGAVFHALLGRRRLLRRRGRRLDLGPGRRSARSAPSSPGPSSAIPSRPGPTRGGRRPAASSFSTIVTTAASTSEAGSRFDLVIDRLTMLFRPVHSDISQTAFQSGFCHPRGDVITVRG